MSEKDDNRLNVIAKKLVVEIRGMVPSMAYMIIKSSHLLFRVNKIDGVPVQPEPNEKLMTRINVDVSSGVVSRSWIG
jgi:hypothetical protein